MAKNDQRGATGAAQTTGKKGRDALKEQEKTEKAPIERRLGSASSGSRERAKKMNQGSLPKKKVQYDSLHGADAAIDEFLEPADQVRLLPLKARLIFKKAMKELDQVDLINSDQVPMSRPRIRAILKQMKDNIETGESLDPLASKKVKESAPRHQMLSNMGR